MAQKTLSRSDVLLKLDNIANTCSVEISDIKKTDKFTEEISTMFSVVYGLTYPPGNNPFRAGNVQKRQVACYTNCVRRVFDGQFAEAFWELYDFIEAGKEALLNPGEMLLMMTALLYFRDALRKAEI